MVGLCGWTVLVRFLYLFFLQLHWRQGARGLAGVFKDSQKHCRCMLLMLLYCKLRAPLLHYLSSISSNCRWHLQLHNNCLLQVDCWPQIAKRYACGSFVINVIASLPEQVSRRCCWHRHPLVILKPCRPCILIQCDTKAAGEMMKSLIGGDGEDLRSQIQNTSESSEHTGYRLNPWRPVLQRNKWYQRTSGRKDRTWQHETARWWHSESGC